MNSESNMAHNKRHVWQLYLATCHVTFKTRWKNHMTHVWPTTRPIKKHLASEAYVALHMVANIGEIWMCIAHKPPHPVLNILWQIIPMKMCTARNFQGLIKWEYIGLQKRRWLLLRIKKSSACNCYCIESNNCASWNLYVSSNTF